MKKRNECKTVCAVLLVCVATTIARAQTFSQFLAFDGANGSSPSTGSMAQGPDGAFYGTTIYGGANGVGTVFRISTHGRLQIYSFCSQLDCTDGSEPVDGVLLGPDGEFYGTTTRGGANGSGTFYKISQAGRLTTLYNFCSQANCANGTDPRGLMLTADGSFYGTTDVGGAYSGGTLYRITPTGEFRTLYNFCSQPNCSDGSFPRSLMQARDGNIYGVTLQGGESNCGYQGSGCGTVFRMTPPAR